MTEDMIIAHVDMIPVKGSGNLGLETRWVDLVVVYHLVQTRFRPKYQGSQCR